MYLSRVCYMELFYGPLRVELRTGEDQLLSEVFL